MRGHRTHAKQRRHDRERQRAAVVMRCVSYGDVYPYRDTCAHCGEPLRPHETHRLVAVGEPTPPGPPYYTTGPTAQDRRP